MVRFSNYMKRKRYVLLFVLLLLSSVRTHSAEIPEAMMNVVRDRVDSGKTVGMVIGLVDAHGVSYYGYGKMAESDDRVPGKDTVFEIGSISKVFTATLLADAVSRGEVRYEDSIETYLPKDVKVRGDSGALITMESLSVQNSGLPRLPKNLRPKDPKNPYADYSVEDMYKALSRLRVKREVGEAYEYSNFGVGLLGHLLERSSGLTYEELVVERIATVLGMPETRITLSDDMKSRLAKGHADGKEVPNWDLPALAGAGAIRSTAQDMIVFLEANMGLRESSLHESMVETHLPRAQAGHDVMQIGLGWHILTPETGPAITWHNGGTGGYRSFAGFTQDPLMGVFVLTNSSGAGDDDIGFHLLNDSLPLAPSP